MNRHHRSFYSNRESNHSGEKNEWIERDSEITKRSQEFRAEIEILLTGQSKEVNTKQNSVSKKHEFLQCIAKKCAFFNNCYEPYEVIAKAYEIGQNQILEGGEIPNPEAWMKSTTFMLLRKKAQTNTNDRKKIISLDIRKGQDEKMALLDTLAAPVDPQNPFLLAESAEEEEIKSSQHRSIRNVLRKLTKKERKLIKLRKVENKSWEEIASELKFKGNLSALRKQGSRVYKKVKAMYEKNNPWLL